MAGGLVALVAGVDQPGHGPPVPRIVLQAGLGGLDGGQQQGVYQLSHRRAFVGLHVLGGFLGHFFQFVQVEIGQLAVSRLHRQIELVQVGLHPGHAHGQTFLARGGGPGPARHHDDGQRENPWNKAGVERRNHHESP